MKIGILPLGVCVILLGLMLPAFGADTRDGAKRIDGRQEIEELEADPEFLSFVAENRRSAVKAAEQDHSSPNSISRYANALMAMKGTVKRDDWDGLNGPQYEAICKSHPANSEAWRLFGDWLRFHHWEEHKLATEKYERSTRLNPENVEAWHGLAECFDQLDKHEEEIAVRKRIVELVSARKNDPEVDGWPSPPPSRLEATAALGDAFVQAGKLGEAATTYRRLLDSLVTTTTSKNGGVVHIDTDEYEWTRLQRKYALISVKLKNYGEALQAAEKGLELRSWGGSALPTQSEIEEFRKAPVNVGKREAEAGHYEAAIAKFQEAIVSDPPDDDAAAFYDLGIVLFRVNKPREAGTAFHKATTFAGQRAKRDDETEQELLRVRWHALMGEAVAKWKSGEQDAATQMLDVWAKEPER
jgi:tetratricopeptide (TPR) repeat protein